MDTKEEKILKEIFKVFVRVKGKNVGIRESVGIGSDIYAIRFCGTDLCFTSDSYVEGVHFREDWLSGDEIAERTMRCAISDLGAGGAKPLFALINLSTKNPKKFLKGFLNVSRKLKCPIVGGDISYSDKTVISIFAVGKSKKAIGREGAKVGEKVFLTGEIGASAIAVKFMEKYGRKEAEKKIPSALEKYIYPEPKFIKEASSATDLSDGLYQGLKWLSFFSKVSFFINSEKIPIHKDLIKFGEEFFKDILGAAISFGDDYEIIYTSKNQTKHHIIGNVQKKTNKEIIFSKQPKKLYTFEHPFMGK